MTWKIKPHAEMDEEEQKIWKRTIKQKVLKGKTVYPFGSKGKGMISRADSDSLGERTLDLDKWLGKKEKEGFEIDETPDGITLEKEGYKSHRTIFIGKDSVSFELKKKKADKGLGEVV